MSNSVEDTKLEHDQEKEHILEIISLKQSPRDRMILQINLILVCVVAVFLFVFFSVPDGGPTAPSINLGQMIGNSTK